VRAIRAQLVGSARARGWWLIWPALVVVIAVYAAHQDLGVGGAGADALFNGWINGALLWASAVACLVGAVRQRRGRSAWILVALALACWAIGDTTWSIRFGPSGAGPLTSISDVFWLAWYPLILAALVLLVRDRIHTFELHRWIDGVAVMLLVIIPWVFLFLDPVHKHSHASALAAAIDFAYPFGNALVLGSTLGVYALAAWRPGRMWLLLGLGFFAMSLADSIYAVQALEHVHDPSATYSAFWSAGAVLVAYASWQRHPGRLRHREVYGWPAVVLPLIAQAIAVSIQVYGFFHEIPRSERIITLIVLVIAMVQIGVTRPRRPPEAEAAEAPAAPPERERMLLK
jgi:hypothetical protein